MAMEKNPLNELTALLNKLTFMQKIILAAGVGGTILLLGILMVFLNEPTFTTLYSNLAEKDAAQIVQILNSQKISYEFADNGSTIKVPSDVVYETRLKLSSKGLPGTGIIGYEIFDKNTMGMSKFLEKLNYKRALEGELARTIIEQKGVEGTRVLITLPEKSLFKDEEKLPTASVVLKLSNRSFATKSNIDAIVHLVASSVEGLPPENVTVLDSDGRLLSETNDTDGVAFSSSKQYEIQQKVEGYLANKAQQMLDNVLGYGNSIVKVNAELNFNQVEKTIASVDPESQVSISEQITKYDQASTVAGDSTGNRNEVSTINYELSKTTQTIVEGTGNIAKLSIAAVINDIPVSEEKAGVITTKFQPRSQQQIDKLEQIIKNAVGYNNQRKDQFSIVNIPFETQSKEFLEKDMVESSPLPFGDMNDIIRLLMILVAIGASISLIKKLMYRLKNEKIMIGNFQPQANLAVESGFVSMPPGQIEAGNQMPQLEAPKPAKKKRVMSVADLEDEITDEAARNKERQERITNYVAKNPIDAAKLINAWLHEDEY